MEHIFIHTAVQLFFKKISYSKCFSSSSHLVTTLAMQIDICATHKIPRLSVLLNTMKRLRIPDTWQTTGEIKGVGQCSFLQVVLRGLTVSNNANALKGKPNI